MRPETALILETRGRRGVALTRDGRFLRVALPPGAALGQEIELVRPGRAPGRGLGPSWGLRLRTRLEAWLRPALALRLRPAWAVALFLVLLVGLPLGSLWVSPRAEAYLSLDINPSFEMGLGRWGTVLSLRALNPEGEEVLSDLGPAARGLKGRPVGAAVSALVSRAAARGYLSGPGSHGLVLGLAPARDAAGEEPEVLRLLSRARGAAADAVAREGVEAGVSAVSAPAEVRAQAQGLGLSVGKYAVLLVARESGLELDPERLADTGVGRAIQEAGGRPQEVLRALGQERDLASLGRKYQAEKGKPPGGGAPGGQGGVDDARNDKSHGQGGGAGSQEDKSHGQDNPGGPQGGGGAGGWGDGPAGSPGDSGGGSPGQGQGHDKAHGQGHGGGGQKEK